MTLHSITSPKTKQKQNQNQKSFQDMTAQEQKELSLAIERRIMNLVIGIPYGIEKLLKMMNIVVTDSIPTAAVPVGQSPKLYVNPIFIMEHCDTEEKLLTLILHELHHILLGHTRLYQRVTPQHNLAFDAIINAMLSRMNPKPAWTALFREYYAKDEFPFYFLRPPEGFPEKAEYPEHMPQRHRSIIDQMYYKNGGSFHELFHLLTKELRIIKVRVPVHGESLYSQETGTSEDSFPPENPEYMEGQGGEDTEEDIQGKTFTDQMIFESLLGNHDHDERGHEYHDNPEIFAAIRAIVERWPQPKDPLVGRSFNNLKTQLQIHVEKPETPEMSVKKAIVAAAKKGTAKHKKYKTIKMRQLQQVYPTKDRRAFSIQAGGFPNLLYKKNLFYEESGIQPVHIYIDVSGSMGGFIADILSAVISCKEWIQTNLYTFSNGVEPTTIAALEKGLYTSTGGTDIIDVTKHIKENKFKNVVLLTDGYVGPPAKESISYIHGIKFHVVLTKDGFRKDLEVLNPKFHVFQETNATLFNT